jgi:hypothetical protein
VSRGRGWIDVETDRRSWSARGGAQVPWEPDEQLVRIEAHEEEDQAAVDRESRERQDRR